MTGTRLLVFGSFADDSQSVLAAVNRLALVPIELALKVGSSIARAAQGLSGSLELLAAERTNRDTGSLADVLNDSEGPFRHDSVSHKLTTKTSPVESNRHHYLVSLALVCRTGASYLC